MKVLLRAAILLLPLALACEKKIDKKVVSNETGLLELRIKGQMGKAVIERTFDESKATVYVLDRPDFPYSAVPVEAIVVSVGARSGVQTGQTLDFNNPERKCRITIYSEAGTSREWNIYLQAYDAFYVGRWAVVDIKLHCNQYVSGSGTGEWDTQLSGSEFGTHGLPEYDNIIEITMDDEPGDNYLTGTITNNAGNDGKWGNFWGVLSPYSDEEPLDMNPRLRHLLPPGTATWKLDLTTEQMRITKDNVTSTMIFGTDQWDNTLFRFILPDAGKEPERDGFYNNMWRSSTELFYIMTKIN